MLSSSYCIPSFRWGPGVVLTGLCVVCSPTSPFQVSSPEIAGFVALLFFLSPYAIGQAEDILFWGKKLSSRLFILLLNQAENESFKNQCYFSVS